MYNKCSSCGKLINDEEDRRIIMNEKGEIVTRCMECFNKTPMKKFQE